MIGDEGATDDGGHWALDLPDGLTIEALADSLIREAEAVLRMRVAAVRVHRVVDPEDD
jgi:hypothetical protein